MDVRVDAEKETVWLTQAEMAELFGVDRSRITRHLSSIYKDGELDKSATCAESAQVQIEGTRTACPWTSALTRGKRPCGSPSRDGGAIQRKYVDTIGLHLRNIYREEELETSTYEESSVVRFESNVRRTHFANDNHPNVRHGVDQIESPVYSQTYNMEETAL